MKIRTLIIFVVIVILAVSIISISLAYNQEIKLAIGMMTSDEKPESAHISDPICFVMDRATGDLSVITLVGLCLLGVMKG